MADIDGGKVTSITDTHERAKGVVVPELVILKSMAARNQVIEGKDPPRPGRPKRDLIRFIERRQIIISNLVSEFPSEKPTDIDVAEAMDWEIRRFQRWKSAAIETGLLLE